MSFWFRRRNENALITQWLRHGYDIEFMQLLKRQLKQNSLITEEYRHVYFRQNACHNGNAFVTVAFWCCYYYGIVVATISKRNDVAVRFTCRKLWSPWALFYQTGLRVKHWSCKFSNRSETCNIAATCLKFCFKQRRVTPLLDTKCSGMYCNIAGFRDIWKIAKLSLNP